MTDNRDEQIVREDEKAYHKIVAKSWLDSTLRDRLRDDPKNALGVTRLTAEEALAVSRFLDEDVEEPQPPDELRSAYGREDSSLLRPESRLFNASPVEDRLSTALNSGAPTDDEPAFSMNLPRLAAHFTVRAEPPDPSGREVLHFVSSRRAIKFEGFNLTSFHKAVLPLLDGRHTVGAIESACAPLFRADELRRGLQLLASHRLLHDAATDAVDESTRKRLAPQLNFFHELGLDAAETQATLSRATVSVIGMGGAGAAASLSLAGAHVGHLRCIDAQAVSSVDPALAPAFPAESVGRSRARTVADSVKAIAPTVKVSTCVEPLNTEEDVLNKIAGSDFVLCFVDSGLASLTYKVNRACLRAGITWTGCSVTGFEGIIGPTVEPYETACYLCYKMREAACAERPEDALAHLEFLDARKSDDSVFRENTAFSAGVIGNMVALEAFKELSGIGAASSAGSIIVLDFLQLTTTRHLVVRKPDCPACAQR